MMKNLFFIIVLLSFPMFSAAQNFNGRISSSLYSFQRFDDKNNSDNYLRTFQTLQFRFNYSKFSLKSRVNLETDVSKKLIGDPRIRFYNLYLEGRNLWNMATVKLGRQSILYGPITGLFDGAHLKLHYSQFTLSGFYGGNVPAYQKLELTDDWKSNSIGGAKIQADLLPNFKLALGYVNKNFKSREYYADRLDDNYNPVKRLIEAKSNKFSYVSFDASYFEKSFFDVSFNYRYDLNFTTTSRIEFFGRYSQVENLGISVYYNYRAPRIRYNSIFAVFDYANTSEIEGGLDYKLSDAYSLFGKAGYVTYEDDNSQRFTIGLNSSFGSISYRKTMGYAGELDAFSVYAARSFMEGLFTPSWGFSYTSYKLSPDEIEKSSLLSFLLGLNFRPMRILSFDLQGQLYNNKIYKNDYRLLFKINYWFNTNLN